MPVGGRRASRVVCTEREACGDTPDRQQMRESGRVACIGGDWRFGWMPGTARDKKGLEVDVRLLRVREFSLGYSARPTCTSRRSSRRPQSSLPSCDGQPAAAVSWDRAFRLRCPILLGFARCVCFHASLFWGLPIDGIDLVRRS